MHLVNGNDGKDPLPVLGSKNPDALSLGRLVEPEYGVTNRLKYGGELHSLVFGPNGKGKGTRILMPNLLQMSGNSIVVVDPKGELAAVTAPYRRTLGRVVIINPFGVLLDYGGYSDLASEGFNPLAALDPSSPTFNNQASLLANALVTVESKDPHWSNSARALCAALLMYTAQEAKEFGERPTMKRFRELLCMASGEGKNDMPAYGLPALAEEMMKSAVVGLRNKAAQFTDWNREIQSVASTARIQTEPFDDEPIAKDMEKGRFDFRELKKEPLTVYLILPPEMLERHAKWLRLVLTSALVSLMRPRQRGEPKTLFMLDEFYALGHLEIISTVWALVRGYGIQIMPVLQDLPQLKKLYPDMWETFVGMAGAVVSFGPNDLTTAEWLARRAGDTTRQAVNKSSSTTTSTGENWGSTSNGSSSGSSSGTSYNESESSSPVKVPLIAHHHLFGLRPGFALTTLNGLSNIIPTYIPAYYQITSLIERARENPYYMG